MDNGSSAVSHHRPHRIHDLPESDRPREKLAACGPSSLTDAELLAIFFRTGGNGMSAIDLGRSLLERHGSLLDIGRCSTSELLTEKGIGPAKASELSAAFELATRLARQRLSASKVDSPEIVYDMLAPTMRTLRQEVLKVLLLNTRYHLIRIEEVFRGSLNESVAHPREILRQAVIHAAYAFIVVHNHPSGDPAPSSADRAFTRRLQNLAAEMQIELLDHVIVGLPEDGRDPYFSFREMGLL